MIDHNLDLDSDDSASEEEYANNKYHLNIMEERAFWQDNIYGKYIPKIEKCRKCNKQTFSLIEKNSIINPIIFSCNNYKCKSRYSIRYNTFFDKFPKTPISVLTNIIKWFIVDNANARIIYIFELNLIWYIYFDWYLFLNDTYFLIYHQHFL